MEQQEAEQLPAAATSTQQAADTAVVVNMELQLVVIAANNATSGYGNAGDYRVLDVKARPIGGGGGGYHVVVDVDRLIVVNNVASSRDDDPPPPRSRTADNAAVPPPPRSRTDNSAVAVEGGAGGDAREKGDNEAGTGICCVMCKKPAEWVAIGRCGHRVVCSPCMVTTRFFQKNKKCCVCRTPCPKVLVTKAAADDDSVYWDGAAAALSKLPRFAFRDGRVGDYWYHGYTRAFFDDEKQYQAARAECQGIITPWYRHPPVVMVVFFVLFLAFGASLGYAFSTDQKGWPQVRTYIISISVALFVASVFWFSATCAPEDPEVLENTRQIKKLEEARRIRLGHW